MITKISMEFAGMGEFDRDDYMFVYFRVDDGPVKKIFGTFKSSYGLGISANITSIKGIFKNS